MPLSLIRDRTPAELIDEGFPADLVTDRLTLFERHGI